MNFKKRMNFTMIYRAREFAIERVNFAQGRKFLSLPAGALLLMNTIGLVDDQRW